MISTILVGGNSLFLLNKCSTTFFEILSNIFETSVDSCSEPGLPKSDASLRLLIRKLWKNVHTILKSPLKCRDCN